MTGLVSLSMATRELRFRGDSQGRKLFRHLRRREKQLGAKLIHETAGGQKRVSVTQLRAMCPELRTATERSSDREQERAMDRELLTAVSRHYNEHAEPQVRQLMVEYQRLSQRVTELERKLGEAEGPWKKK